MKETTEIFGFIAKLVDATFKSLDDGKFGFPEDLTNYFAAFLAAPEAVKGIDVIGSEAMNSTAAEKDAAFDVVKADMPNVPAEDRSDIGDFLKGIYSIYRLGKRQGFNEGVAAAKAELKKSGKIK